MKHILSVRIHTHCLLQDGLRRRMEDLKKNIHEAHEAVQEEQRKNVELLRMVFPSEIAQKLWRSKSRKNVVRKIEKLSYQQHKTVHVIRRFECTFNVISHHTGLQTNRSIAIFINVLI